MYAEHPVLDVHSHVRAVVPASAFLSLLLGSNTPFPSPLGDEPLPPFIPMRKADMVPMSSDKDFHAIADKHAAYIEARAIETQIVGPHPVEVHGWLPAHLFKSWTSFVNDMIFKVCQARPDRFVGACQLPQLAGEKDTTHVLEELERCVTDYGFVATYLIPDPTGERDTPAVSDPYWFPLYEHCEDKGVAIIVHGAYSKDPRFPNVPINPQMAFLTEQYFALQLLRHSDVFERFPRLRVLICHCGGALDRFIREAPLVTPYPERDLSGNLFFDTCAYDTDFLAAAINQRTPAQSCFGSEAPGAGATVRPETGRTSDDLVPIFADHPKLAFLTEEEKLQILHHNPIRFCPGLADPTVTNAKAVLAA